MSTDLTPSPNGHHPAKRKLTLKETRFVDEYLVDGNASRAVRVAYPEIEGVATYGHELLRKPHIAQRVAEREAERVARLEVTQDQVVLEMARVALSDPRKLFKDGKLRPVEEWPDDVASTVASIETEHRPKRSSLTKVRMWNKTQALDQLARILKLYEPDAPSAQANLTIVFRKEY